MIAWGAQDEKACIHCGSLDIADFINGLPVCVECIQNENEGGGEGEEE